MTGDQQDVLQRLKARLPPWFGENTPVVGSLLNGLAYTGSFAYSLYAYASQQARIKTASGQWLDAIALDFFGRNLQRSSGQTDTSFQKAIIAGLFRERVTRRAVTQVLLDITGRAPIIFEPNRAMDTGAYEYMSAYDVQGGYGDMNLPFQAFVTAFRPAGSGIPLVAGYGISVGAYDTQALGEYADPSMMQNVVADSDIMAAIDSVKPVGSIIWTRILSNPNVSTGLLDVSLVLDSSVLAGNPADALNTSFVLDASTLQ